jgi:hypothetical protein
LIYIQSVTEKQLFNNSIRKKFQMNRISTLLVVLVLIVTAFVVPSVFADSGYPYVNSSEDCAINYPGTVATPQGEGYLCVPIVPPVVNPPIVNPPIVNPPVVNPPTNNSENNTVVTPAAPPVRAASDTGREGEISFNDTDLGVVLHQASDANGNATLEVLDMHNNATLGSVLFTVTHEDLVQFVDNLPVENTLLYSVGHVSVYVLTTGEIQMNVGPDSEGKIHVKIFDGIPWSHVYGYVIEPAA